jgi:outer membrane protein assembly factor BamB
VDISGDSYPDIIANAVEGKLLAFNGKTHERIWTVRVPDSEAYSSIAPGYFTSDRIPDFIVSYAIGQWPKLEFCKQVLVDGATGHVAWKDSLGFYQTSTPVVVDLDGNGRDEALISINLRIYDKKNESALYNIVASLDFGKNEVNQVAESVKGSNISSTPWIGDMDGDSFLDIVYCHGTNPQKTYTFDGMQIHRIATKIPIRNEIPWGSYMGSYYDGIFRQSSTAKPPQ